jgi:hypothetical protein
MSYGLEIRNGSNALVLDANARLQRAVQTTVFSLGIGASTTIPVPGLVNDGTWAFSLYLDVPAGTLPIEPDNTVNTGSISFTNTYGAAMTITLSVYRY